MGSARDQHRRQRQRSPASSTRRTLDRHRAPAAVSRSVTSIIQPTDHLGTSGPITIDPCLRILQPLGSPIPAPRIRRVSHFGRDLSQLRVQLILPPSDDCSSHSETHSLPLTQPISPSQSSGLPGGLRHQQQLSSARFSPPQSPSNHPPHAQAHRLLHVPLRPSSIGGTPCANSRAAPTSSIARSPSPPTTHMRTSSPRARSNRRSRGRRSSRSSPPSYYGPTFDNSRLLSTASSFHAVRRSPSPFRAPRSPRSATASAHIPALLMVQRRLLSRQRLSGGRR